MILQFYHPSLYYIFYIMSKKNNIFENLACNNCNSRTTISLNIFCTLLFYHFFLLYWNPKKNNENFGSEYCMWSSPWIRRSLRGEKNILSFEFGIFIYLSTNWISKLKAADWPLNFKNKVKIVVVYNFSMRWKATVNENY